MVRQTYPVHPIVTVSLHGDMAIATDYAYASIATLATIPTTSLRLTWKQ